MGDTVSHVSEHSALGSSTLNGALLSSRPPEHGDVQGLPSTHSLLPDEVQSEWGFERSNQTLSRSHSIKTFRVFKLTV